MKRFIRKCGADKNSIKTKHLDLEDQNQVVDQVHYVVQIQFLHWSQETKSLLTLSRTDHQLDIRVHRHGWMVGETLIYTLS